MLVVIKIKMSRSTAELGKVAVAKHVTSGQAVRCESTAIVNSSITIYSESAKHPKRLTS
jgi:hypothetical protein